MNVSSSRATEELRGKQQEQDVGAAPLYENQFPAVEAKRGEASVAREVEEFLRCLACLTSSFYEIVSIGNVESFSIVAAGLVYILEAGRRKEKEHQETFELILAARESGFKGHLGRIRALEDLAADGLWRDDFDLHGIYLEGLRVPGSRWRGADFTGSLLKGTNFRHADLQRATFLRADLSGVTSDEGFRAVTHPQPLEK